MSRQIVLDTETTGLDPKQGHRIIEIGCVELINRRLTGKHFQYYINPHRDIDEAAVEVHGITSEFLADKPGFDQIEEEFIEFVRGAELVIHNAPFDMGFLDSEISNTKSAHTDLSSLCRVLDTLQIAREKHPGQRNNLDALCKRYGVDNTQRDLHGALLDAEILADVYLIMTSGQSSLSLKAGDDEVDATRVITRTIDPDRKPLPVLQASTEELNAHEQRLQEIAKASSDGCLWQQIELSNSSS